MQRLRNSCDTASKQENRPFLTSGSKEEDAVKQSRVYKKLFFLMPRSRNVSIRDTQLHMGGLHELHPGQLSDYPTLAAPQIWFKSRQLSKHGWHI